VLVALAQQGALIDTLKKKVSLPSASAGCSTPQRPALIRPNPPRRPFFSTARREGTDPRTLVDLPFGVAVYIQRNH
jgi:hypothetical protein